MFARSAPYYDLLKSRKSYEKEAAEVEAVLKSQGVADGALLLVAACGTGEHERFWKARWRIHGFDINPEFVRLAGGKNPECHYYVSDMMAQSHPSTVDAVIGMYGCIGYCITVNGLAKAMTGFAAALDLGGILIIEPWYTPDEWQAGKIHVTTIDAADRKLCRMGYGEPSGNIGFHYLIGDSSGVECFYEYYEFGLFTHDQIVDSASLCGLKFVDRVRSQASKRGLMVFRKQARAETANARPR